MSSGTARRALAPGTAAALVTALLAGCFFHHGLDDPQVLYNPHGGRQLWAVAPFANESGVSTVDTVRVADTFTQQLEEVDGIDTVPVNRVLLAMRHLEIDAIASPSEAMDLIRVLGVDAILVGTVTAYDPYPPPSMGAAIQLFVERSAGSADPFDPRELVRAPTGTAATERPGGRPQAVAQASGVFDSRNHRTLKWLGAYATGRTQPDGAFGAEVYLMDMELYTQFVSYRLIHDLLAFEQARMTPVAEDASTR